MTEHARAARASGLVVCLAGLGFVGAGLWGRREVQKGLARERIVGPTDSKPVASGAAARALAEFIRARTVESAGGRTYAETELYLDAERQPTSDREQALEDDRSGEPVQNPEQNLWLQSTTLQTALNQAYMGSRLAELTIGIGAVFLAAGAGLAAAARFPR